MNSLIIGTSGHIDHGKTALINALNGFNGDETKAEKERGITIDLSFSNLNDEHTNIAFIDVPGHENLVKTMISGAFGFDACLLVISSTEGVKPQTKEHVEILSYLEAKNIILVISKCDLADEQSKEKAKKEAIKLIKSYPNLILKKTFFVSTKDLNSIKDLKQFLLSLKHTPKDENKIFRYYIDRVFKLKGHGTIVTGSVLEGKISINEKVLNLDLDESFIVKNIEISASKSILATAPNRVALNLIGDKLDKISKGQILSKKGFWRGFLEIDCVLSKELPHNSQVMFCVGSKQVNAKAAHIKDNFFTLKFDKKMFLRFDEKFILLQNNRVICGGRVLNPVSDPLKKEVKFELLKALSKNDFLSAFSILTKFHRHGFGLISSLQRFNLDSKSALKIATNLDAIVDDEALCIYAKEAFNDVKNFILFIIEKNKNALFSNQSINIKLSYASPYLIKLALNELEKEKIIEKKGGVYAKFGVDFKQLNQTIEAKIFDIIRTDSLSPLAPYNIYDNLDIDRKIGDDALKQLTKSKKVIRLAHNLFISSDALNLAMIKLRELIKTNGKINISIVKNELNLSRKYALAYLEYLDNFADIKKIDNDRVFI